MLVIIDNQSSYLKKFKRNFLAEQDFSYIIFDHNQPIVLPSDAKVTGLMLSGGRGNPYEPLNLTANFVAMMNFDVPTIGFCLGHEILAIAHRGRIRKLSEYQSKKDFVVIDKPGDPIFKGLNKTEISLQKKHSFHLSVLPPEFVKLGHSTACPFEIIRHKDKPLYGFQSHPEVSGPDGILMIRNFLKMCGIETHD